MNQMEVLILMLILMMIDRGTNIEKCFESCPSIIYTIEPFDAHCSPVFNSIWIFKATLLCKALVSLPVICAHCTYRVLFLTVPPNFQYQNEIRWASDNQKFCSMNVQKILVG